MELTVRDLIVKLELLAQDAKVVIEDDNGNEYDIDNVQGYSLLRGDTTEKIVTLTSSSIDTSRW
jgi:hypothetical protein